MGMTLPHITKFTSARSCVIYTTKAFGSCYIILRRDTVLWWHLQVYNSLLWQLSIIFHRVSNFALFYPFVFSIYFQFTLWHFYAHINKIFILHFLGRIFRRIHYINVCEWQCRICLKHIHQLCDEMKMREGSKY